MGGAAVYNSKLWDVTRTEFHDQFRTPTPNWVVDNLQQRNSLYQRPLLSYSHPAINLCAIPAAPGEGGRVTAARYLNHLALFVLGAKDTDSLLVTAYRRCAGIESRFDT